MVVQLATARPFRETSSWWLCRVPGVMANELQFVKGKILECPYNESSWSYFRSLLSLPDVKSQHGLLGSVASFTLQVTVMFLLCFWTQSCICVVRGGR